MNRGALLVYLHDIRDLEVAKYQIEKMRKKNVADNKSATGKIQSEINAINTAHYMEKPDWSFVSDAVFGGLFFLIVGIAGATVIGGLVIFVGAALFNIHYRITGAIILILCLLFFLLIIGNMILECSDYIKARRKVRKHNAKEKERLEVIAPSLVAKKNKIKKEIFNKGYSRDQQLKKELQKVTDLLKDAYSLNILAKPYRNLPSVYYIYEYMSTSQSTLEETFLHEHMENGFQRIEKKLDIIIEQNEEIIFSMRQIEAKTEKTVEQTTQMLNNLQKSLEFQQRTEQNTLEAAQYASICATYSRVNAFFSTANYLCKGHA